MTRIAVLALPLLLALAACSEPAGQTSPPPGGADRGVDASAALPAADTARLAEAMSTPAFRAACEATPGCTLPGAGPSVAPLPAWRILVTRDPAGNASIASIELIDVSADAGVPLGPEYGELAVVGLDASGEAVDGQLVRFPSEARNEYADGRPAEIEDLSGAALSVVAYLQASARIARIVLRGNDGSVVDSAAPPAGEPAAWIDRLGGALGIASAHAVTRPFADLPPHCSHIIVLQGEEDRHLFAGASWQDARLGWPGPYQLAALRAALERMTPLLCQSIGRIAFAWVEGMDSKYAAVKSRGAGDTITINASSDMGEEALERYVSRRLWLQQTLTHEAAHTAETLLTVEGSSNDHVLEPQNYRGAWGLPARTLAGKTIDNVRLEAGMEAEWRRLHASFVSQGWASDYNTFPKCGDQDERPENWAPEDVVRGGFMSQYASCNWAEDIADTVGHVYYSKVLEDAYAAAGAPDSARLDFGCKAFRQHGEDNVPSHYAALYTKLRFAQDLGLVRTEDVEHCLGDHLGLPVDGPGFHLWHQGEKRRVYDTAVTAKMGQKQNGAPVFEMQAEGSAGFGGDEYETTVKLRLDVGNRFQPFDKISWPRGVYPLGLAGDNNFTLRLDGAPAGNFDTMDGFALVAQASHQRIAGSLVIQRVFRLNAPLPVPERYDPPLVIRFLIEK